LDGPDQLLRGSITNSRKILLPKTSNHHLAITCGNESWFFKMLKSIMISEIGVVLAHDHDHETFLLPAFARLLGGQPSEVAESD
jgi:hypothetical protein